MSAEIDETFEKFCFDMDVDEARQHILNIISHMLGLANEIRIMSNAQIRKEAESDEEYLKRVQASEVFLTERVASYLDRILADEKLELDESSSEEIFHLMSGGVTLHGEYIPVEIPKVYEAMIALSETDEDKERI